MAIEVKHAVMALDQLKVSYKLSYGMITLKA
jgi:hypothetical protein